MAPVFAAPVLSSVCPDIVKMLGAVASGMFTGVNGGMPRGIALFLTIEPSNIVMGVLDSIMVSLVKSSHFHVEDLHRFDCRTRPQELHTNDVCSRKVACT